MNLKELEWVDIHQIRMAWNVDQFNEPSGSVKDTEFLGMTVSFPGTSIL